ncbi:MAG: hypothetical protein Q9194_006229 [Teloschistes cf. exilis]
MMMVTLGEGELTRLNGTEADFDSEVAASATKEEKRDLEVGVKEEACLGRVSMKCLDGGGEGGDVDDDNDDDDDDDDDGDGGESGKEEGKEGGRGRKKFCGLI